MNTKKMQVLSIEQTGHIMAVFTRAAAPEALFDIKTMRAQASLAGTDLLVRNLAIQLPLANKAGGEILSVPIDLLKPEIVELNEKAFVMPFNFMVGGGQANDLRLSGLTLTTSPSLDSTSITIDLGAGVNVPEETKVWAQVQERNPLPGNEPIRRIIAGAIQPKAASGTPDGHSVKLDLRTRPDEPLAAIPPPTGTKYSVLVLVAGIPPGFFTK